MYAFWKYDQVPYMLGAKLSELKIKKDNKGEYMSAYINSYRSWFRIEFTLDDEEGKLLCNHIENSRNKYSVDCELLKDKYKELFKEKLDSLHPSRVN